MINIEATKSTPKIIFSEQNKTLTICGECYPENSFTFFKPIFDWFISEFSKYTPFTIEINISYMNSSSTKCMLDILELLENASDNGQETKVIWYYDKANERALDLAEEFKEDFNISFEIIAL